MNRIILIGNGFDLAHGLKTSYKGFIEWIWESFILKASKYEGLTYEDNAFLITCKQEKPIGNPVNSLKDAFINYLNSTSKCLETLDVKDIKRMLHNDWLNLIRVSVKFVFKNKFLESLLESHSNKGWVDIEEEYYQKLKELSKESDSQSEIKALNDDLEQIKNLLDEYLQETASSATKIDEFDELIFAPFLRSDFINDSFVKNMLTPIHDQIRDVGQQFSSNNAIKAAYVDSLKDLIPNFYYSKYYQNLHFLDWFYFKESSLDEMLNSKDYGNAFLSYFAVPKDILFLNFNYTPTAKYYAKTDVGIGYGIKQEFKVNHIHGELSQTDPNNSNPMIFGYGDEISEEYKQLENLNDNKLLENVKSIRYLEASNYRDLISFIESDEYQVYIMGHSCGISDRTLLNTLFEHKNCVSIKPFYHEWTDKTEQKHDNYREIVQNISRNFADKVSMRNKVVNKKDCNPLPQNNR